MRGNKGIEALGVKLKQYTAVQVGSKAPKALTRQPVFRTICREIAPMVAVKVLTVRGVMVPEQRAEDGEEAVSDDRRLDAAARAPW